MSSIKKILNLYIFSERPCLSVFDKTSLIMYLARGRDISLCVLNKIPISSEIATCFSSSYFIPSSIASLSSSSSYSPWFYSPKAFVVACLIYSQAFNILRTFCENSFNYVSFKKHRSSYSITDLRVSISMMAVSEVVSSSIVLTKIPIKYLVILTAAGGSLSLTALTKFGRHLPASYLTSSLVCLEIISQRRVAVS